MTGTLNAQPSNSGAKTPFIDKFNNWLGLAPQLTGALGSILSLIRSPQLADAEKDMAIQGEFYKLQANERQKQQQTIIIAAVVCVLAILITVMVSRKK